MEYWGNPQLRLKYILLIYTLSTIISGHKQSTKWNCQKKSCFLLTANRMIAKNRSHNHMRELQLSFCKLIVIFFFFLGFCFYEFVAQITALLWCCMPYNESSWTRNEKKLHFLPRNDLEYMPCLSTSLALQMIDITVVSCSEIITYGGKWALSKETWSETIGV